MRPASRSQAALFQKHFPDSKIFRIPLALKDFGVPVSYTHLDVYKRQIKSNPRIESKDEKNRYYYYS